MSRLDFAIVIIVACLALILSWYCLSSLICKKLDQTRSLISDLRSELLAAITQSGKQANPLVIQESRSETLKDDLKSAQESLTASADDFLPMQVASPRPHEPEHAGVQQQTENTFSEPRSDSLANETCE